MKNDKEHGRILRIVSYRGRVKLFWCSLDKDGDVDKVLKDEDLDFSFKNLDEMQALIELVEGARKLPVLQISSSSYADYFGEG